MEIIRCEWVRNQPDIYIKYHDEQWGVPVHDDRLLFQKLVLDGAQAGLSWLTILKKRDAYIEAFDGFDIEKVACYDGQKIEELICNAGIVRNRLKVNSAIKNAKAVLAVQNEFGSFDKFLWGFTDGRTIHGNYKNIKEVPSSNALSDTVSKEMKRRGMSFVGTTIIYAYLQAIGILNDHTVDCFRYHELLDEMHN